MSVLYRTKQLRKINYLFRLRASVINLLQVYVPLPAIFVSNLCFVLFEDISFEPRDTVIPKKCYHLVNELARKIKFETFLLIKYSVIEF
jgi:hypothetical protein